MNRKEVRQINNQAAVKPLLGQLSAIHPQGGAFPPEYWRLLEQELLIHKVKFPVLEYVAKTMSKELSTSEVEMLLKYLAEARHMSCYPIIGKLLQLRLEQDLEATYASAVSHIIQGDEWYVCDIISERVFGESTLLDFDNSLALLRRMGDHENIWIQRSIGIAGHYATKKKLPVHQVEQLLLLMVKHAHKTQYFVKKGIGWAGKTIAKYHPALIKKHESFMRSKPLCRWFVTKVNTGLSMAQAPAFRYE